MLSIFRKPSILLLVVLNSSARKASKFTDTKVGDTCKTAKTGTLTLMDENLNLRHFRNGESTPQITANEKWENAVFRRYPFMVLTCIVPDNGNKYGIFVIVLIKSLPLPH